MAYSSKYIDKIEGQNYWVIIGDGEAAEGNIWESANFAGAYGLDNLFAFIDVNRLGQS